MGSSARVFGLCVPEEHFVNNTQNDLLISNIPEECFVGSSARVVGVCVPEERLVGDEFHEAFLRNAIKIHVLFSTDKAFLRNASKCESLGFF